jgi:hypothetical protein
MTTPPMNEPDEQEASGDDLRLDDTDRAGLADLITGFLGEEKTGRRAEVRKAWQQRSYRAGIQHIWYDDRSYSFMTPKASGVDLPQFMDCYNLYTPHYRSFVSILSQNPPGINFVPDDLQAATDVTAASYAEKMRHRVDRMVHMKDRQQEVAGLFCTDGRTIGWARVDAKGKLCVTAHGVLESKVPIYARHMDRWGYVVLSEEMDLWEAKEEYPDYAEDLEPSTTSAEAQYEALARMNVIGSARGASSDGLKNIVTRHTAWIRPSRYRKATDELKEKLPQMFPDGVRVTMLGKIVCDAVPERIEDALVVQWPSPGQGQNRPSLLHDLVPIQDAYNDYKNNLRESAGYINPATWVDGDAIDSEALPEQRSEPGAIHVILPKAGKSIQDSVFQEASNGMSPELSAACAQLLTDAEFISGDLPAVFGAGTPDSETATGQKMLADQAKGQLSMAWAGLQWWFAGIYVISVRLAATLDADKPSVSVAGGNGQDSFSPSAILDGNFGCYPDTDSSFPETMADKRASLQSVLTQLGQADAQLVLHPDNLKLVKQYSGLADFYIPQAAARDKQLSEIDQMLKEVPIPETDPQKLQAYQQAVQQAQASGQPPPPEPVTSSVKIGSRDFHEFEVTKVNEWMSSESRREEERKGNFKGVHNVDLHGDLHDAAIAAKAAANAPQQTPMSISGSFKDLDPATKVQVLQRDGYQPDPSSFQTDAIQAQQSSSADTQLAAANAQHKSVLAAKEAVQPAHKLALVDPSPDQVGLGEK